MVLIKIANVQEMVIIDKSNKWFHTRRFFQMVFTSYKWYRIYIWYQPWKMMVPQVILNFKWSSNEECIPQLQELKCIN